MEKQLLKLISVCITTFIIIVVMSHVDMIITIIQTYLTYKQCFLYVDLTMVVPHSNISAPHGIRNRAALLECMSENSKDTRFTPLKREKGKRDAVRMISQLRLCVYVLENRKLYNLCCQFI